MNGGGVEEIVIVGSGLAGASAACILTEAGRPVLLLERDAEPRHKVCGEFLSIEAQTYLARLGVDLDGLGASRISHLRLVRKRGATEVPLPFVARGLSRKILDEALLFQARSRGARIVRGEPVRSISVDRSAARIEVPEGVSVPANTVFPAAGKHDVRGVQRVGRALCRTWPAAMWHVTTLISVQAASMIRAARRLRNRPWRASIIGCRCRTQRQAQPIFRKQKALIPPR
ncbi:NAD-binding protein (plasmid) [Microvirga terrae]|uniref:NAD-binding protein n=1 Tax=Microvirga terrae TaxID=2740529 RepID=A0ABY5S050_9HYPH|nr:NAD-binding protein [Microvirga terrae]UVF22589.1 NAD-binding protein [Microvirga terrae]